MENLVSVDWFGNGHNVVVKASIHEAATDIARNIISAEIEALSSLRGESVYDESATAQFGRLLTRAHDDNGSFIKHMLHQAMYNFVGQDLTRLETWSHKIRERINNSRTRHSFTRIDANLAQSGVDICVKELAGMMDRVERIGLEFVDNFTEHERDIVSILLPSLLWNLNQLPGALSSSGGQERFGEAASSHFLEWKLNQIMRDVWKIDVPCMSDIQQDGKLPHIPFNGCKPSTELLLDFDMVSCSGTTLRELYQEACAEAGVPAWPNDSWPVTEEHEGERHVHGEDAEDDTDEDTADEEADAVLDGHDIDDSPPERLRRRRIQQPGRPRGGYLQNTLREYAAAHDIDLGTLGEEGSAERWLHCQAMAPELCKWE